MSLLLALALQAAADPGIVVSSKRLDDAYAECVAGKCPPLRDAQVSIAWAEARFRDGAYVKAKAGLAAAARRNSAHAATDPKPLAAIHEAHATVAMHDGDLEVYKRASEERIRTLRANLPANDPAIAEAEMALGDMWAKLGKLRSAEMAYETAERNAAANGLPAAALNAALRRAWLAAASFDPGEAQRIIDRVAASEAARDPAIQAALPVVRLRLAAKQADDAAIDTLVSGLASTGDAAPTLLWAPPYDQTPVAAAVDAASRFEFRNPIPSHSAERKPITWADIGFWVRPDGRTADVEVLRGTRDRNWLPIATNQIAARRYSTSNATGPGVYRVERFTLRGTYEVPIGSLVPRRGGSPRLEVIDLTEQGTRVAASAR